MAKMHILLSREIFSPYHTEKYSLFIDSLTSFCKSNSSYSSITTSKLILSVDETNWGSPKVSLVPHNLVWVSRSSARSAVTGLQTEGSLKRCGNMSVFPRNGDLAQWTKELGDALGSGAQGCFSLPKINITLRQHIPHTVKKISRYILSQRTQKKVYWRLEPMISWVGVHDLNHHSNDYRQIAMEIHLHSTCQLPSCYPTVIDHSFCCHLKT
jgi:hypothetical protein